MKKLFSALLVSLLLFSPSAFAAQQTINNTESLFTVRTKLNSNFTELYADQSNQTALQTLSGVSAGQSNLGAFTGSLFPDNQTIKQVFQAVETELQGITDTDDQTVDVFSLGGTTLSLSLEADGEATKTVDLSSLQDGTGTDDQNASEVAVTDAGANYTATDVEGILAEIAPQLGGAIDVSGTPVQYDLVRFVDVDTLEGLTYAELAAVAGFETALEGVLDLSDLQGTLGLSQLATTGSWSPTGTIDLSDATITLDADDLTDGATNIIPTSTQETNWDTAFGWGDHAGLYQASNANLTTYAGIAPSANVQSVLGAANYAGIKGLLDQDDLQTLTGIAAGVANLGTFTGTTITDSQTIKVALQELEVAIEAELDTKTFTATASNAFAEGEVGFMSSAGTVTRADASAEATAKNLLVVATEVVSSGGSGAFILRGDLTLTSHGYTLGTPLFLSETDGGLTVTAPPTSGSIIRVVGYALDANTVHFAPSATWIGRP